MNLTSIIAQRHQFSPLSLSPALWLSDTGSDPSVWPDLSGNGGNAVQSNSALQPTIVGNQLNGRQIRRFNGSTTWLYQPGPFPQPLTLVFVAKTLFPASTQSLVHGNNASVGFHQSQCFIFAGDLVLSGSPGTAYHVLIYEVAGAVGTIRIDGVSGSSGSSGIGNMSSLNIGKHLTSGEYFSGDMAELFGFQRVLTTSEKQSLERYLGAKWGITIP